MPRALPNGPVFELRGVLLLPWFLPLTGQGKKFGFCSCKCGGRERSSRAWQVRLASAVRHVAALRCPSLPAAGGVAKVDVS